MHMQKALEFYGSVNYTAGLNPFNPCQNSTFLTRPVCSSAEMRRHTLGSVADTATHVRTQTCTHLHTHAHAHAKAHQ